MLYAIVEEKGEFKILELEKNAALCLFNMLDRITEYYSNTFILPKEKVAKFIFRIDKKDVRKAHDFLLRNSLYHCRIFTEKKYKKVIDIRTKEVFDITSYFKIISRNFPYFVRTVDGKFKRIYVSYFKSPDKIYVKSIRDIYKYLLRASVKKFLEEMLR